MAREARLGVAEAIQQLLTSSEGDTRLRSRRGAGRSFESAPLPAQVVVQPKARNETGPDAAGNGLQLAVADQRANLVLRAAKLGGDLADGEWCGPVHGLKYRSGLRGSVRMPDDLPEVAVRITEVAGVDPPGSLVGRRDGRPC